MKRCVSILFLTGFFISGPLTVRDSWLLWAQDSIRFTLQVSAFSSLAAAQKEMERLKTFQINARYMTKEDRNHKEWYVVYADYYETREEAVRQGARLVKDGIIQNYYIFPMEIKEEPGSKIKESPLPKNKEALRSPKPPPKENKTLPGKTTVYFGPVVIKEEEYNILMTISLSQRIFPKISTQKHENNSHLLVTFKDIDKQIVPIDFRKDQGQALLSVSLIQKGSDCTFDLVLNPSFNYEVSQNYFEQERIYSLRIRWESSPGPNPVNDSKS